MTSINTNDIRIGMKVEVEKDPYLIIANEFVKPGKGQAFNRIKMKNMKNARVIERTYKSGDKLELAEIEEAKMRYLYQDGDGAVFMNDSTFDQITLPLNTIQDQIPWLMEEILYDVIFYKGAPIDLIPPTFMEMTITDTSPGVRGDTASGRVLKPATTQTGAKIQVPIFVETGEKVKVDTRNSEYVSRVNA